MKKLVAYCFLLIAGIGLFYLLPHSDTRGTKSSLVNVNLVDKSSAEYSNNAFEDLPNKQSVIGIAINKVQSLETFETTFSNLSSDVINSKLLSSDGMLKDEKIFQQANSSAGPDQMTAIRLVELMRSRQALNKILIDRQLNKMRRKLL